MCAIKSFMNLPIPANLAFRGVYKPRGLFLAHYPFTRERTSRPVSNERSGNSTFYRGIHEFLNPSIFVKILGFFLFYAVIVISQKIT